MRRLLLVDSCSPRSRGRSGPKARQGAGDDSSAGRPRLLEQPGSFERGAALVVRVAAVQESREVPMSKPIVVGYDATSSDQAPVRFSVAAARCIRAPLIIVCVYATAAARDRLGAGQVDEDLGGDATAALEEIAHELEADGIRVEYRGLEGENAARALHEVAAVEQAGLLVVGSRRRHRGALPGDRAAPRGGVLARRAAGAGARRRGGRVAKVPADEQSEVGRQLARDRRARFARAPSGHLRPRLMVGIVTALAQRRTAHVAGGQRSALAVRLLAGWLG